MSSRYLKISLVDQREQKRCGVCSMCVCVSVCVVKLPAEGVSGGSLTVPQKPRSWACRWGTEKPREKEKEREMWRVCERRRKRKRSAWNRGKAGVVAVGAHFAYFATSSLKTMSCLEHIWEWEWKLKSSSCSFLSSPQTNFADSTLLFFFFFPSALFFQLLSFPPSHFLSFFLCTHVTLVHNYSVQLNSP